MLYRYPVKGFKPESCEELEILPEGRVAGDRVLGFRFANSRAGDEEWGSKHEFVALVNTPGIANLSAELDSRRHRLLIRHDGDVLVEDGLDAHGRRRIALVVERYVQQLAENPLSAHPDRLPLRLVGDGITSRFQDSKAGQVTLHSRESLAAVADALADSALDEQRFRTNVVIQGTPAWEEQQWVGQKLRIGDVGFRVVDPKTRCLATHANPETGVRDRAILQVLVNSFGQSKPTFAVGMLPDGAGGRIRVGDEVQVISG